VLETRVWKLAGSFFLLALLTGSHAAAISEGEQSSRATKNYLHINPAAFSVDSGRDGSSGYNWDRAPGSILARGVFLCFSAPVTLPHRARIETVSFGYDGDDKQQIGWVEMYANDLTSGYHLVGATDFSDDTLSRKIKTLTLEETRTKVDNKRYSYNLRVCLPGGEHAAFFGARIQYTI
jgi:hypothetical protein